MGRSRVISSTTTGAYLLASGAYVYARTRRLPRLCMVAKPWVSLLLAGEVLRLRKNQPRWFARVLLSGLAGGFLGDLLLLEDKRLRAGALAFGVNQAAFICALWGIGARFTPAHTTIRVAPVLIMTVVARTHAPLVLSYGLSVALMSALAAKASQQLAWGGNSFFLSDALIGLRLLSPRESPVIDAGVAATYALAQYLLIDGLLQAAGVRQR